MWSKSFQMLKQGIVGAVFTTWVLSTALSHQGPAKVDFRRDVHPLLKQFCIECHGPSQQMHGFRLDRRRDAMRGGTGTMIAPGNSAGSRLYLKLIGNEYGPQMPATGPLTKEQIDVIKAWIDQGAEWPDDLAGDTPPTPPDPKAAPVMRALVDGDMDLFKKLAGADKTIGNLKGAGGITPLMQAVLYGDLDSVRLLLQQGADPNIRNEVGATALMWAVDDLEKTRLLIEHGADVNARSNDARTPLLIAAGLFGNTDIIKLLLDRGADLAAKSPTVNGYATVLSEAARLGDESLLRMLIDRGADVKSAGVIALANADRANCEKCFELLMEPLDRGILTRASAILSPPFGGARAVKALLGRGVDANARGPKGNTLLMLAASSDAMPVETVKALIERGANLNATNPEGKTALDFSRMTGSNPIADLLGKAGAKESAATPNPFQRPKPAGSARAALERSIPLLQKADAVFLEKSGCVSCHHNTFTSMTVSVARNNGFKVDEQIARDKQKKIGAYIETWRERSLQGVGIPGESNSVCYILLGLAAENYPPDPATDALARFLKSQQWPNGQWQAFAHRPPMGTSDFAITASALRSLQVYGAKAQQAKYGIAVKRAADWLMKAQPQTTDDRVFQLLGLAWAGIKPESQIIKNRVRDLIAEQRAIGGWAQIPGLASDAYATGQALAALRLAGEIKANDPAYKRGVEFLLTTQLADGSWYVKSRAIPLQPYFEGGFPHGHDQWISAAATNWASMGLTLTAGPPQKQISKNARSN